MVNYKNSLKTITIIFLSFFIGILFCELILRVKHHYIVNYDIEMWKYAKKLKVKVENKKINHVHVKNKSAILQKTEIKINNFGQRDINYDRSFLKNYDRSFLILGSSVAMGWGVDYQKVFTSRLNQRFAKDNKKWIIINGGLGIIIQKDI